MNQKKVVELLNRIREMSKTNSDDQETFSFVLSNYLQDQVDEDKGFWYDLFDTLNTDLYTGLDKLIQEVNNSESFSNYIFYTVLDPALEEIKENDGFGTEGQNDPREGLE